MEEIMNKIENNRSDNNYVMRIDGGDWVINK